MRRLLTILALFGSLTVSAAAQAYSVSMTSSPDTIGIGDVSAVTFNLGMGAADQLAGFNFAFAYDPGVLAFDSFLFNGRLAGYVPRTNASTGLVTFEGSLGNAAVPVAGGVAPFGYLLLKGSGPGTSTVELTGTIIDTTMTTTPVSGDAFITVADSVPFAGPAPLAAAVPEPGTVMLLGLGVALVAAVTVRKRCRS